MVPDEIGRGAESREWESLHKTFALNDLDIVSLDYTVIKLAGLGQPPEVQRDARRKVHRKIKAKLVLV